MRSTWIAMAAVTALSAGFTGCSDDDEDEVQITPAVVLPEAYVSPDFAANAATELSVLDELSALTGEMKKADGGNTVNLVDLQAAWNNTSLKSVTDANYQNVVDEYLETLANASASGSFDPDQAPAAGSDGFYGSHLLDQYGIEPEQIVEKGLFEAALFNHALTVISGEQTPAMVDQLVAIFGANPSFPNSDSDNPADPDIVAAKYAARRTKASGGIYLQMKGNAIMARTYLETGGTYAQAGSAAANQFLVNWEASSAATIINYLQTTISKLSATNPSDDEKADALHAYSEAVGFAYGWYHVPEGSRVISNATLESVLADMLYPVGGTASSYRFVTEPAQTLPQLQDAIDALANTYGFSNEEVEGFKSNWVNEEGR